MKNLVPKRQQTRGYPDSIHATDGNSSSSPAVPNLTPPQLSAFSALSLNPHSSVNDPPIAYPYAPHQDFKLKAGNNKNLNKDAAQKIGTTRIGNITTTSQFGGFPSVLQGRRVDLDIGNNENQGTTQEIGGLELFNVDGPPTHQDRGSKCSIM